MDKSVTETSVKKSVEEVARDVAIGRRDGLDTKVCTYIYVYICVDG